jgi:hypothetical protein
MKINRYQIVVVYWGLAMFAGYAAMHFFAKDLAAVLVIWTFAMASALFVQSYLLWNESFRDRAINLVWLAVCLVGAVLTYVVFFKYLPWNLTINALWFGICALGMAGTALLQKAKLSYFLLAVIYAVIAIYFQFINIADDLLLAGVFFFLLGILDAALEYTQLRKGLANFIEEGVVG